MTRRNLLSAAILLGLVAVSLAYNDEYKEVVGKEGHGSKIERTPGTEMAVMTYGRFQPPHLGHSTLLNHIKSTADQVNADSYIFVSPPVNDPEDFSETKEFDQMKATLKYKPSWISKNPLDVFQRIFYLQKLFPGFNFVNSELVDVENVGDAVKKLKSSGYTDIFLVVPKSKAEEYQKALGDQVIIVDAPEEKHPNAPTSDLRAAAVKGDFEAYKKSVVGGDLTPELAHAMMNHVRWGLALEAIPKPKDEL